MHHNHLPASVAWVYSKRITRFPNLLCCCGSFIFLCFPIQKMSVGAGTNCILPGMACVVRMAPDVTVNIPPERMLNSSQQARSDAMAKLKQAVVGSILCMPTELGPQGASAYSEAVFVHLKQGCFPISCKDTGALVTLSGLEDDGASSCAPASPLCCQGTLARCLGNGQRFGRQMLGVLLHCSGLWIVSMKWHKLRYVTLEAI